MKLRHLFSYFFILLSSTFVFAQPTNYKGIGIAFGPSIYCDGYYGVTAVLAGGPADRAGIKKDYCIIAVDGKDVKEIPQREIVNMIKGPEGTTVTITIQWDEKKDIEVYRGDIDPMKFVNQASEKWIAERTSGEGMWSGNFEKRFDGILYIADAARDHFEPLLDEVEYDPVNWGRTWEFKSSFREKYVLDGSLVVAAHYYVSVEIPTGSSKEEKGKITFKDNHEVIKYWIDKKLKPKGYVISEFKNEESDMLNSFFLHKPGDSGEFHEHPQIKFIFSGAEVGEKELSVEVYSAYSEEIKNLRWNERDPRRNRGRIDMEQADACISGDCIDGYSTFVDSTYSGEVHFKYIGEMKNGLAHGKGKLEEDGGVCEGNFWRGYKDGTLICKYDWGEVMHERYDKGKFISRDSEEMAQALKNQLKTTKPVTTSSTPTLESAKAGVISAMNKEGFKLTYSKYGYGSASYPLNVEGYFYPPSIVQFVVLTPEGVAGQTYGYVGLNPKKYQGTQWASEVPGGTVSNMQFTVDTPVKMTLYGGVQWGTPYNFYILLFEK